MKCSKCGFELKEDEKFCGNCGASISEEISAEPSVSEEVSADEAVSQEEVAVPSQKKSKLSKVLIVLAAVVVVLGACFFAFKDVIVGRVAFLPPYITVRKCTPGIVNFSKSLSSIYSFFKGIFLLKSNYS